MEFNAKDVDTEYLLERAKKEAHEIFFNHSARRGRTFEEVYQNVLYGQTPEVYLIKKHNFTDNPDRYQDIIEPSGGRVEVKTTRNIQGVSKTLMRVQKQKKGESWRNLADILYIFIGDEFSGDYTLHGIFDWHPTEKQFHARSK